MARKTKEELKAARTDKWISEIIQSNKFLRAPKFYQNNYWSWAAWDSWAAQGKAGSCGCGCGYYNATLKNKRAATEKGGKHWSSGKKYPVDISRHLCSDCVRKIEIKIEYNFQRH